MLKIIEIPVTSDSKEESPFDVYGTYVNGHMVRLDNNEVVQNILRQFSIVKDLNKLYRMVESYGHDNDLDITKYLSVSIDNIEIAKIYANSEIFQFLGNLKYRIKSVKAISELRYLLYRLFEISNSNEEEEIPDESLLMKYNLYDPGLREEVKRYLKKVFPDMEKDISKLNDFLEEDIQKLNELSTIMRLNNAWSGSEKEFDKIEDSIEKYIKEYKKKCMKKNMTNDFDEILSNLEGYTANMKFNNVKLDQYVDEQRAHLDARKYLEDMISEMELESDLDAREYLEDFVADMHVDTEKEGI